MAQVTQNLAAVLNKVVEIDIQEMNNPRVSCVVALFLLSLVFLVITHGPLVHALAWVILNADHNVFKEGAAEVLNAYIEKRKAVTLGFGQPDESLEEALEGTCSTSYTENCYESEEGAAGSDVAAGEGAMARSSSGEGNCYCFVILGIQNYQHSIIFNVFVFSSRRYIANKL